MANNGNKTSKFYMLNDGEENADLYIFGNIYKQWSDDDPDRGATDIVRELNNVSAQNITVHINSNGGDVGEGLAIYNTLKNSGKSITTIDDGFACSAASVVFMAGSRRVMNAASLLMIHNPWTIADGNADQFRKMADDLDTIAQASVNAYKERSNLDEDTIKSLMDAETWILPEQALEYGFATEILFEDSEGVQQSAMKSIMQKLTVEPVHEADASEAEKKLDAIGQKVDSMMEAIIKAFGQKPQPKKVDGFNTFFN